MKTVRFMLISLVIGIVSASGSHGKEIKLIGIEAGNDNQYLSADIIGRSVVIGAHAEGHARIYDLGAVGGNKRPTEIHAKDHNAERVRGHAFGWSVAIGWAVSSTIQPNQGRGDFVIVGAPRDDHAGLASGSAYIFARDGGLWKQRGKLIAKDPGRGDTFGHAVDIDGGTAIIGSPQDDDAGNNSGSAYVFARDGAVWRQQAKLVPKDSGKSDIFGDSVFIAGDTIVVGSPRHTHSEQKFAGAVYIFEREGTRWVEKAKLTADDAVARDRFGHSVSISGNTCIVGAPENDAAGEDAGAAYVFERVDGEWKQEAKLKAEDTQATDQLGTGVATTGSIAIVGAGNRNEEEPISGAAYSFARIDGVWEEKQKVVPSVPGQKIKYGFSVAMSGDNVVISAHNEAVPNAVRWAAGTAAYVYNSVEDFNTPRFTFAVDSFGLSVTTLAQVKRTALFQNFPNPFNPETWMPYRLAADVPVTFRIYNLKGEQIRALSLGEQKAGNYINRETAAYWDGTNQVGESVSSGIYYYSLQAGTVERTRRMVILK